MPRARKKVPTPAPIEDEDEEELDEEDDSEEEFQEDALEELQEDEVEDSNDAEIDDSDHGPGEDAARGSRLAGEKLRSPAIDSDGHKRVARRGRPAIDRRPRGHSQNSSQPEQPVDTSSWLGTAEATALVKRHARTLTNWRVTGKVKAAIGPDGCWRYNPDDLVEMMDEKDQDSPSTMMAVGMTTIVQQGDRAGQRLLEMTAVTTEGLERTCEILQSSLEAAYERIAELEKKLAEAYDRGMANLEASYKHERWMQAKKFEHEKEMADAGDRGTRLASLLSVLGPIGATIAARMGGDEKKAENIERAVSRLDTQSLPFEARAADAMGRLDLEIRELDETTYAGFRLMVPVLVQKALDTVRTATSDSGLQASGEERGKALATVIRSSLDLPKEQFERLAPIAPAKIVAVLTELRKLNEEKS